MNMVSNILGNFDEIDSADQSQFLNVNIRNRRQKILFNMSFETEVYDIFDPIFTSEEDASEVNSSESSGSMGSSANSSSSSYTSDQSSSYFTGSDDSLNNRDPPRAIIDTSI